MSGSLDFYVAPNSLLTFLKDQDRKDIQPFDKPASEKYYKWHC